MLFLIYTFNFYIKVTTTYIKQDGYYCLLCLFNRGARTNVVSIPRNIIRLLDRQLIIYIYRPGNYKLNKEKRTKYQAWQLDNYIFSLFQFQLGLNEMNASLCDTKSGISTSFLFSMQFHVLILYSGIIIIHYFRNFVIYNLSNKKHQICMYIHT